MTSSPFLLVYVVSHCVGDEIFMFRILCSVVYARLGTMILMTMNVQITEGAVAEHLCGIQSVWYDKTQYTAEMGVALLKAER